MSALPPFPALLTLEQLMKRLSDHLDGLAAEVHQVEHAIGADIYPAKGFDGTAITKLQSLDFLRQSLEDLSLLTLFLAQEDADGQAGLQNPAKICGKLRLQSTKALFGAQREESGFGAAASGAGEVDFF